MNINDLKKQLQNLGVSTSTPGLVGEDRFEELSFRLESSQKVKTGKAEPSTQSSTESSDTFVVPSLSQLSIGEIRSRLTALGESTATPGVTGEERRTALMRRLIDAVCVNDEDSNIGSIASTIVAETLKPTPIPAKMITPVKVDIAPVSPAAQPAAPVQVPAELPSPEIEVSAAVTAAAISALKNDLKRLVNQRAMAVASKLSGSQQDEQLKACETRLVRIEAEAAQFKALVQKGETKLPAESIQSEFLVLNPGAASFAIESLISRLDGYRTSTKDKIREHRLRIREEGDDHPQFGVAAEEKLKIQLSEANLASAKSGKVVVSRARQKLSEVKDIETQLQQEGRVASVPDSPTKPSGPFKVELGAAPVSVVGTSTKLGSSPKDKPPVHNTSNKIQTGVAPRATLPTSPDVPQPKTADKWSTEIAPHLGVPNRVEKPTKVDILASKLPNFTSSFLGKAIDLDSGSLSSKSEDRLSGKKEPAVEVVKPIPVPVPVPAASVPAVNPSVAAKPSKPVAPAPGLVSISSVSRTEEESGSSAAAGPGPVGSVKLSTVPVPVIPGRRPPPRPEGGASQGPPGVDMTHPQQGAFAQSAPARSAAATNEEEDAAFDFHAAEFDEDHDEYFREVSEAESRKDVPHLQASSLASGEEKEEKGVHRISTEDEDARKSPLARRENRNFTASNDSEPDDTHDSAAAYMPEDGDDLDNDSDDYDRLYGTRRMDVEEGDDDLEELPGSRSSRTPMRTHSNSSFGDGNRLDPLPEAPQDSRSASGSRSNSRNGSRSGSRSGSRGENRQQEPRADSISPDAHQGPPVAPHLPPIEESDFTPPSTKTTQRKSFVLREPHNSPRLDAKLNQNSSANSLENSGDLDYTPPPTAHKAKKPIYDLGGNLAPNDDEGEGLEAFEEIGNGEEGEEDRLGDEKIQIRILRSHAKVLEGLNDTAAAEAVHLRALELDPMNISTLEGFAVFLHQKKGELARAEAFFNRGLQVCLPGVVLKTGGSATNTPQSGKKSVTQMSFTTDGTMQGSRVKHIVKFILSYAQFLSKAKGDLEAASILYKKGIDLAPDDAFLLATYAHFLAQVGDGESNAAASEYFQRALKISPGSGQYAMWYGKLLKKTGKTGQAELMYKVALEQSKGNEAMEATAMCNYATFVFKQRKDPERANVLFKAGLGSYPEHKGLRKNYAVLVKAHPQFASDGPAPAKKVSKSAADRAQLLAQNALNRLSQSKLPLDTTAEGDAESERGDDA